MWSIGVTTYLLLSGDTPFNGKNRQQLFRRISCDDPPFPDEKWDKISYEALDFVRKLLEKDPAKRLSAKQALAHLWLRMNENGETTALEQSQQKAPIAQSIVSESNAELSNRKAGGSSGKEQLGEPKSPRSPASRSSPNRQGSESAPSPPSKDPAIQSSRSGSSDRTKSRSASGDRTEKRTSSREQTTTSRGVPPPPPKPQLHAPKSASATTVASRSDRGGSAVANQILHNFGNSADDVNARLLDVIKDQDAKIEKLERLVKQMLEP
jgi:serine/threonine protein kinase